MDTPAIYAIPGTDRNLPAISKHCLGDCRRLAVELMIVAGYPSYICHHADCQHISGQQSLPGASELSGQQIIGRIVRL